jgi:hypothetical protein
MNKILKILLVLLMFTSFVNTAVALTFEQAYSASYNKPGVVLIYAKWADGAESTLNEYKTVANYLKNTYNFAVLDLASNDAKFFNTKFDVHRNLPYVMMFRDGGKVCRFVPRDCASDARCLADKLKSFIK